MISRILIISFAICQSLLAADFDDFDTRRYFPLKPIIEGEFYSAGRDYFNANFLHSNPYGMENLSWNYLTARYSKGRFGAEIFYRSTGFERYYLRNRYKITAGINFYGDFSIIHALEVRREDFGDFGTFSGSSIDISADYVRRRFSAAIGLAEIILSKSYDMPKYENSQPFAAGSLIFDKGAELTIGVRRFENRRVRWIFNQELPVTRNVVLNFGYQNKPSNIRGGIEFAVEGFSVILNYISIGGLDDSVVWGISFEK